MPAMGKSQTCLVKLFSQENVTGCEADEIRYPALKLSMLPNVVAYKNNYTCYERTEGSIDRKIFGPGWCSRTIKENETEVGILVNHNLTRADVVVMRRPENKKEPTRCLEGTVHTYKYGNAVQNNKRRGRGHKGRTKTS